MAWEILNPALQIMVYWIVFGLGIRSNAPIHGIPFVFWLLVGISMWFFINQGYLKVPNLFHKNLIKLLK